MREDEFWEMRLCRFFAKLRHAREREERSFRRYADLVRMQTVTLLNIQLERRHRIKDARKLWVFPWEQEEQEEVTDEMTEADREEGIKNVMKLSKLL